MMTLYAHAVTLPATRYSLKVGSLFHYTGLYDCNSCTQSSNWHGA